MKEGLGVVHQIKDRLEEPHLASGEQELTGRAFGGHHQNESAPGASSLCIPALKPPFPGGDL